MNAIGLIKAGIGDISPYERYRLHVKESVKKNRYRLYFVYVDGLTVRRQVPYSLLPPRSLGSRTQKDEWVTGTIDCIAVFAKNSRHAERVAEKFLGKDSETAGRPYTITGSKLYTGAPA